MQGGIKRLSGDGHETLNLERARCVLGMRRWEGNGEQPGCNSAGVPRQGERGQGRRGRGGRRERNGKRNREGMRREEGRGEGRDEMKEGKEGRERKERKEGEKKRER